MQEYFAKILEEEERLEKVAAPFRFVALKKQAQYPSADMPPAPVPAVAANPNEVPPKQPAEKTTQPTQTNLLQGVLDKFQQSPVLSLFTETPAPGQNPATGTLQKAPGGSADMPHTQAPPSPAPSAAMNKMGGLASTAGKNLLKRLLGKTPSGMRSAKQLLVRAPKKYKAITPKDLPKIPVKKLTVPKAKKWTPPKVPKVSKSAPALTLPARSAVKLKAKTLSPKSLKKILEG